MKKRLLMVAIILFAVLSSASIAYAGPIGGGNLPPTPPPFEPRTSSRIIDVTRPILSQDSPLSTTE